MGLMLMSESRRSPDCTAGPPQTVTKRFLYRTPGLYLFVLRVYQLTQPYFLPMHKRARRLPILGGA